MEAPDGHPRRLRRKPSLIIALVAGFSLVAAWLGWAIYVASDRGVNQGIGVLVAWPALLVAALLVALPFVGLCLLIRRLSGESPASDEPGSEPS